MRTIRKTNFPEEKAAALARRRWLGGGHYLVAGGLLVCCAVLLITPLATVGALALVALVLALFVALAHDGMNPIPATLEAGIAGEAAMQRALSLLDDGYVLFTGLIAPGGFEVDGALAGPHGLILLEVKAYVGTIVYDADGWRRIQYDAYGTPRSRTMGDPVVQVGRARGALTRYLTAYGLRVPVQMVVVFSNPTVQLDIEAGDTPILRLQELLAYVKTLHHAVAPAEIATVASALDALPLSMRGAARRQLPPRQGTAVADTKTDSRRL